MKTNYLRPTELLKNSIVSKYFSEPRAIGQLFSLFNNAELKIIKGFRARDGVRIDEQSFVNFLQFLEEYSEKRERLP